MSETDAIIDFKATKAKRDRERYAALVLEKFADLEHADKRAALDRKAAVEAAARERL